MFNDSKNVSTQTNPDKAAADINDSEPFKIWKWDNGDFRPSAYDNLRNVNKIVIQSWTKLCLALAGVYSVDDSMLGWTAINETPTKTGQTFTLFEKYQQLLLAFWIISTSHLSSFNEASRLARWFASQSTLKLFTYDTSFASTSINRPTTTFTSIYVTH